MNQTLNFLAGWIIIQLFLIGYLGGILTNKLAMGDCITKKPEYSWFTPIVGAMIPLIFFTQDIDKDKYCNLPSTQK